MYIQPNSIVRLLTNVPLDNTYAHTIYFDSKNAQVSYFEGKTKAGCIFSQQSYQRYAKGVIRLQKLADDIFDCNYMMFQNTAYGNKWFFAFINTVEYISNTVCEITYEIDVMQTWFFDVTLLQSFVEREHSRTDVAGDNIVPEPVPLGEEYMGVIRPTQLFNDYCVIIVSPYRCYENTTTHKPEWTSGARLFSGANEFQKTPTCLRYMAFNPNLDEINPDENEGFNSWLDYALHEFPDVNDIACAYIVPVYFINFGTYRELDIALYSGYVEGSNEIEFFPSKPTSLSHGYTPKNKKLLTYPYNKMVIDTADGNTYDYAFEFFSTTNIRFNILGNVNTNCSFKAVPRFYKGQDDNFTEGCLLTDFPNVGLITDSFKAWIAQNKTRVALQTVSDVLGVGSGLGGVVASSQMLTPVTKVLSKPGAKFMAESLDQVGNSGVRGIGQTIAELSDRNRLRYHPKMGSNDGSLEIAHDKKDFIAMQYSVNPQNALIIDDFFNCYGYATHRVKVPNRNVRPHWTFVKTIDINVESNAPADDTNKICSIYDKGITFWRHANEVGNYSLDNSPVATNT